MLITKQLTMHSVRWAKLVLNIDDTYEHLIF